MLIKIFRVLLLLLLLTKPVIAADEFNITQNLIYTVNEKGSASVNHEISLTNNFSGIYAKEYVIQLSDVKITQVTATDSHGSILQKVEDDNQTTKIHVSFNNPAVGKDKTQKFTLTYNINNFVTVKGKQKEFTLPEYHDSGHQISAVVKVPLSFGNLAFASVNPSHKEQNSASTFLNYDRIPAGQKILIAFGDAQVFDFELKYRLSNTSDTVAKVEIPIPPDTPNQQIILTDILPPPSNITVDPDGNHLAHYSLEAGISLDVSVEGQAKVIAGIRQSNPEPGYLDKLVSESKYWPVSHPLIQNILPNLNTPKDIYDYVIQVLGYNYDQINNASRKGALQALVDPNNSLCTEFTDLFVTLARAKNIPAREIEGYAHTNNPRVKPLNTNADVLHAWPQYWDQNKSAWISVDPTWGKTTNGIDFFNDLDLNHLAFVIHGQNPDYPPPPGSFRGGVNTKTVHVDFASKEISPLYDPPSISVLKTRLGEKTKIKLKNPNPNSLTNLHLSLNSSQWTKTIPVLPPLSEITIEIPQQPFFKAMIPSNQKLLLNLTFDNSSQPVIQQITNLSHYLNMGITAAILIAILSIGGIIITTKITHA